MVPYDIVVIAVLFYGTAADRAGDPEAAANPNETRYALALTDEGELAAGLRVPGPDNGNLLLVQPSFTYRHGQEWIFSTSLAGMTSTGGDTHAQAEVREAYFGLSEGDFDFTIGKRLLRWGTGYAFTATGILDPPRAATDPSDRLSLNEGREMAKADWIHDGQDFTVVWASAGVLGQNRTEMYDTTAFRYNVLVGGFDTSVIVAHQGGGANFAGGNFTRVFGDALELHGEFAWRQGAAVLAGGKYATRFGITMIGELYTPPNTAYYRPAQMPASAGRQHFGYAGVSKARLRELPGWKEWNLSVAFVENLDDRSHIAVFDGGRQFGKHYYAYTHAQTPAGKKLRSEYGMIPYSALVSIGVRFQL